MPSAGFEPPARPLGLDLRLFMHDGRELRLATGERAHLDMHSEDRGRHLPVLVPLTSLPSQVAVDLDATAWAACSDAQIVEELAQPLLRADVEGIDLELTNVDPSASEPAAELLHRLLGREREGWLTLIQAGRQTTSTAGTVPADLGPHVHEVLDFGFVENDNFLVRRDLRLAYGPQLALTLFSPPEPRTMTPNLGLGSRTKLELSTPGLIQGRSGPDRAARALEEALNHLEWTALHLDSAFERWETRLVELVASPPPLSERADRLVDLQRELATMLQTANATRAVQRAFARRLSTRTPDTSPAFHQGFREDGGRRLREIHTVVTEHRGRIREGFELLNSVSAGVQTELSQQAQRADSAFQQRIGVLAAALVVPSLFIAAFGANEVRLPSPASAAWLVLIGGTLLIGSSLPLFLSRLTTTDVLGAGRRWLVLAAAVGAAALVVGTFVAI